MSDRTVVVQLSDPHLGADWGHGDPAADLGAAVRTVVALDLRPDAVLVSGDLANTAADAEYAEVRRRLDPLGVPVVVLPGNHDDRAALRRHFDLPGEGEQPAHHARAFGGLRLVLLDTTRPGEAGGAVDRECLAWLHGELAAEPRLPTLVAMHHHPFLTGVPAWDALGMPAGEIEALAEVIGRHPQVRRLVCGHLHRTIAADLAGRPVLAVPSTHAQARFDLDARELALSAEPAGFAVHTLAGGRLSSHLVPVA